MARAGDLNADGREDIAVGLTQFNTTGVVRVLAGRPGPGVVDARREPPLLLVTGQPKEPLGASVVPAGDLDGDGHSELAIGSAESEGAFSFPPATGAVTIVPGRPGTIALSRPPSDVRRVSGPRQAADRFGAALAAPGDLTGDGLSDLVVGAPDSSPGCRPRAGAAWILPGSRSNGPGTITGLAGAWRIDGARPEARLGRSVGAGDVDGDGGAELLLPALPFNNAAVAELFAIPVGQPRAQLASLDERRCLRLHLLGRSLVQLRRSAGVRVTVTSSVGAGEGHGVVLTVRVVRAPVRLPRGRALTRLTRRLFSDRGVRTVLRFSGPASAQRTIRLPPRLLREAQGAGAYVVLDAEQRLLALPGGGRLDSFPVAGRRQVFPLGAAPPLPHG